MVIYNETLNWLMDDLFCTDDDAESIEDAQNNVNILMNISQLAGFEMNDTKTKLMKCKKKIQISTRKEDINKLNQYYFIIVLVE